MNNLLLVTRVDLLDDCVNHIDGRTLVVVAGRLFDELCDLTIVHSSLAYLDFF